jgi:diguanylate cyclase (GGDEF)-like protein
MPQPPLIEDPAAVDALKGLLDLTRTADAAPLRRVLEAAGEAIATSTGFQLVYMSVYRPEYDDYAAMFVRGRPELSPPEPSPPPIPRDFLTGLPGTPEQRAPGIYFVAGTPGMWEGDPHFYPSRTRPADGPEAWRAEDLLLVLLEDVDGKPLGLLSLDEPTSGMRPSDDELPLLRAICLHVEQALRTAKRSRQNAEDTRMLGRLSEISPQMSKCLDRRELYRLIGDTITAELGFERVAVYIAAGDESLRRVHVRGWQSRELLPERLSDHDVRARLRGDVDRAGAWLLPAQELFGPSAGPRSQRNGRGPLAWQDHCLLVPWFGEQGALAGVVVAEDPVDRLLPREQRRYSLRLLVDLAASIEQTITQRARLDRLASRDSLTGLRNRRGLHQLIGETRDCTVIVCDLDDFKSINDRYGHDTGDLVLARFAEILREQTRDADIAVRLGGDEFCVVLAGSDDGGTIASERIRAATPIGMRRLVPANVTVSVGLARRINGLPSPRALLTAADAALYSAKQNGRDRTMSAGRRAAR